MDDLTLVLIVAGVAVVAIVVMYNAWQGAKVRRRMPQPMPDDAQAFEQGQHEPGPFIEPARARQDAPAEADAVPETRIEPEFGGGAAPFGAAAAARADQAAGVASAATNVATHAADATNDVNAADNAHAAASTANAANLAHAGAGQEASPSFAAPDPLAELVAADMAGTVDDMAQGQGERLAHTPEDTAAGSASVAPEPLPVVGAVATASTISVAPPAVVDRRIDCIVPVRLAGPVAGERAAALAQRLRRAGSKPVHIEGKPEGAQDGRRWELLQNGARYEELRAAVQLANRSGALNELEFSEFVTGVQQLSDALDATPEFPDMMETVAMARELDGFAGQCDAQLSLNILSDGAPWSANYVQAIASQDGLLLARDGTRFVKLDANQSPTFMLQFGDTNFLRDDLTYKGGQVITLLLDVPVANEDLLPFRLMCDYARSLAERIGGRVVDDAKNPLPDEALQMIDQQLLKLYARLEQAGIPAGSPVTRRLFSQ